MPRRDPHRRPPHPERAWRRAGLHLLDRPARQPSRRCLVNVMPPTPTRGDVAHGCLGVLSITTSSSLGSPAPAVGLDPMLAKQLVQPLELAVHALVLLKHSLNVHVSHPLPLPPRPVGEQLLFPVSQRRGPLDVPRLDRGLLLPPHLGDLLLKLAQILGHGHADQARPRTCLLALAGQQPHHLLADPGVVGANRGQHLRGHALALAEQAEQDVLGADVVMVEAPGLLLGEHDHPPGLVGEPLEHPALQRRLRRGRAATAGSWRPDASAQWSRYHPTRWRQWLGSSPTPWSRSSWPTASASTTAGRSSTTCCSASSLTFGGKVRSSIAHGRWPGDE